MGGRKGIKHQIQEGRGGKGDGENFHRNVWEVNSLHFLGVDVLMRRGGIRREHGAFFGMPQVEHRCHFPKYSPAFFMERNLGSGCGAVTGAEPAAREQWARRSCRNVLGSRAGILEMLQAGEHGRCEKSSALEQDQGSRNIQRCSWTWLGSGMGSRVGNSHPGLPQAGLQSNFISLPHFPPHPFIPFLPIISEGFWDLY